MYFPIRRESACLMVGFQVIICNEIKGVIPQKGTNNHNGGQGVKYKILRIYYVIVIENYQFALAR